MYMRRIFTIGGVLAVLLACVLGAAPARAEDFPAVIPLPNGFEPEGIAMGRGATAYVGSESSGAIYKINLRTGEGETFVEAQPPQAAPPNASASAPNAGAPPAPEPPKEDVKYDDGYAPEPPPKGPRVG